MPKFEITQLRSPAAGQPLGYQSNLPDVGGAAIANAIGNAGNTLFKIAEKAIAAETAESVSTAVGQATTELAALGAAKDLKTMGITEAVPEYQRRAKEVYGRLSGALSPGARNAFNRQWSQMAAQAGVTFTGNVINRSIQVTDGQNIKNLDKRIIAASNGKFTLRELSDGVESVLQLMHAGTLLAPVAEKRIIAFRTRFAKQAIVGVINRSTTIDSLNGIKNLLKDDGKELKGDLSTHWKSLDAEDRRTIYSKALTDLGHLQTAQNKARIASDKLAADNRDKKGTIAIIDILAVDAGIATEEQKNRFALYSPHWIQSQIRIGKLKGTDGVAIQKLMDGMGDAQTDLPAVNALTQSIYAIADMPQPQQKAQLEVARSEITRMLGGRDERSRLEVADVTRLNALITKVGKEGFKESPQYKARASLEHSLGVSTAARPRRLIGDPDPQQVIRIERAMREYDSRVADGDAPWDVHQDLLERAVDGMPDQSSYPSLRFGPRKLIIEYTNEDFEEVTRRATLHFKDGRITDRARRDIMKQIAEIKMIRLRLKLIKPAQDVGAAAKKQAFEDAKKGRK